MYVGYCNESISVNSVLFFCYSSLIHGPCFFWIWILAFFMLSSRASPPFMRIVPCYSYDPIWCRSWYRVFHPLLPVLWHSPLSSIPHWRLKSQISHKAWPCLFHPFSSISFFILFIYFICSKKWFCFRDVQPSFRYAYIIRIGLVAPIYVYLSFHVVSSELHHIRLPYL
jgi:hypothetical protein